MIDTLPIQMFVFSLFSAVVTKLAVWVGDGAVNFDEKRREMQDSAVTNRHIGMWQTISILVVGQTRKTVLRECYCKTE